MFPGIDRILAGCSPMSKHSFPPGPVDPSTLDIPEGKDSKWGGNVTSQYCFVIYHGAYLILAQTETLNIYINTSLVIRKSK